MDILNNLAVLAAITISASVIYSWVIRIRHRRSQKLPPHPKGFPIIGHILNLPSNEQWKAYHQWSQERGKRPSGFDFLTAYKGFGCDWMVDTDILYLNFLGQDVVILDTFEAATELLERRSSIYSGRIRIPMLELVGWDFSAAFLDYGPRWRQQIRLVHSAFQPYAAKQFHPHLLRSTHEFLHEIMLHPEADIVTSVGEMAGRTIMTVVFGIQSRSSTSVYTAAGIEGVRVVSAAIVQGSYLVDFLPFLKHVPSWVPGAGFQKLAARSRDLIRVMADEPFAEMKQAIKDGVCPPCFCSTMLQEKDCKATVDGASYEGLVRDTAGALVGAASETTVSVISSCILGLLQNPLNITRAQAELDKVIAPGHLPSFDHEHELPFITAIVYEALRWRDIVPLGIPHKLSQDDVYKGYHIPAGTMVFANMWAMLHDESVYPEPFAFNPTRFMKGDMLDEDVRNPGHATFGFGRRMCPGRHMAFSAIWIAVASIIFCFDIQKARDEKGNIIEPLDEISFGLTCIPKPYKSCLIPRSKAVGELICKAMEQELLGEKQ